MFGIMFKLHIAWNDLGWWRRLIVWLDNASSIYVNLSGTASPLMAAQRTLDDPTGDVAK